MWRSILATALLAGCAAETIGESQGTEDVAGAPLQYWTQAFGNAQHGGNACPALRGMRVVTTLTQDVDAQAENDEGGFLSKHEGPVLTAPGGWVYVPSSSGFTGTSTRTDRYAMTAYRWSSGIPTPGATLDKAWSTPTDWTPVDEAVKSFGFVTNGYVQMFGGVAANGSIYMPGASGRIVRINATTGAVQATIDPLAGTAFSGDKRTVVNNVPSADRGNVYYTVVAYPTTPSPVLGELPRGTWLVKVRPDNTSTVVPWDQIASASIGVPTTTDLCEYPFGTAGTPAPTGPDSTAPKFRCGPQLPAINAPIAVTADGAHLIAFSYANNAQGAAFLIRINSATLAPELAMDTRGHALHGCGARLALTGTCATITAGGTTHLGFDPSFNGPVRFRGEGLMDSAPAIAPDGTSCIGSYDGGFGFGGGYDSRGFGVCFDAAGNFASKNEEFFWEVTPSVLHAPTAAPTAYQWYGDRNLYSKLELTVASYSPTWTDTAIGTRPLNLDATAIDYLDASILVDVDGRYYGVNGDGHLDQFDASGALVDSVDLLDDDGAVLSMETLSGYHACDATGVHYLAYAGKIYVITGDGGPGHIPPARTQRTAHSVAKVAKARRAATAAMPVVP